MKIEALGLYVQSRCMSMTIKAVEYLLREPS